MLKAITCGSIITGKGEAPTPNGLILADGDRIQAVGSRDNLSIPRYAEVVDLGTATLLPGLIDTHVHLVMNAREDCVTSLAQKTAVESVVEAAGNARAALRGGVTTVRDCADVFGVTLTLKRAIDAGHLDGPRILACGLPITTTAGHLHYMGISADSTEEVLKAVRTVAAMGVDWVKVCATGGGLTPGSNVRRAQYSAETLTALVQDAHRLGRKVAAHAHGTEGIMNCAIAGTDSIEHCSWMEEEEGHRYDEDAVELMRKKGLYVSHTITGPRTGSPEELEELRESEYGERYALLRRTMEEGVRMVISSDAGVPDTRFEDFTGGLVIAVKCCGFSPMGAIIASTSRAAEMLGMADQVGSLEPGKNADILAVDGNPLQDISAIRRIVGVFKDGRRFV